MYLPSFHQYYCYIHLVVRFRRMVFLPSGREKEKWDASEKWNLWLMRIRPWAFRHIPMQSSCSFLLRNGHNLVLKQFSNRNWSRCVIDRHFFFFSSKSHHLLTDFPQPFLFGLVSGPFGGLCFLALFVVFPALLLNGLVQAAEECCLSPLLWTQHHWSTKARVTLAVTLLIEMSPNLCVDHTYEKKSFQSAYEEIIQILKNNFKPGCKQ